MPHWSAKPIGSWLKAGTSEYGRTENRSIPLRQDRLSFITGDQAEQMGADMAIQLMLMTLFQLLPEMADDPRGFRTDVHRELTDLVASYKLPPMPEEN